MSDKYLIEELANITYCTSRIEPAIADNTEKLDSIDTSIHSISSTLNSIKRELMIMNVSSNMRELQREYFHIVDQLTYTQERLRLAHNEQQKLLYTHKKEDHFQVSSASKKVDNIDEQLKRLWEKLEKLEGMGAIDMEYLL